MIVLIILLSILGVIVLLGFTSVAVTAEYDDFSGKSLSVRVRWLFITIYPYRKKSPKIRKKRKKYEPKHALDKKSKRQSKVEDIYKTDEPAATETDDLFFKGDRNLKAVSKSNGKRGGQGKDKGKKFSKDDINLEMIKDLVVGAKRPIRHLFSKIRVTDVSVHLVVGGDDAAAAALSYGAQSAVIHNVFALIDKFFKLKIEDITVDVDFEHRRNDLAFRGRVRLDLWTMAVCAAWLLLGIYRKSSTKKSKSANPKSRVNKSKRRYAKA